MDETIKEEIYKCSKCGQCQSVCPVYNATKNEMYLARGRYIVLNNSFNNSRSLNKKFISDLDICLNCNACKRFCPSNIDAAQIYTAIKSENNYKYSFLPFSTIYKILLQSIRIDYYLYKFFPLKSIFINTFTDNIFDVKVKRAKFKTKNSRSNVVYFQGCINKYINPSDKNASLNILKKLGYNVTKIISECCGLPYISDGNIKAFENNSKRILKSIPEDIQYIVCSCDSCYETLKQIPDISEKLIRLDELLKINNYFIPENDNIVFHRPINREENCYINEKINLINQKYSCSLMENFFMIKYPEITKELLKNCFYKKEITDEKIIITTCNLSAFGLKYGINKTKSTGKVYTLSEYINITDNNDKN